ncbi:MAG: glutamate racemase [Ruminococcaceae bacterium]|nr:glutamate racemase [Oscillospiraceae bacterium]
MRYGVFDSGLGGMTVLTKLMEIMPHNDYIYFGDVARVPYGTRSNDTIIKYAKEDAAFLIKNRIDAIIIACGTVSAVAHDTLRNCCNVPVYSVIDFAVKAAAKKTKNKKIGVIGTQATVNSGVFTRKLYEADGSLLVDSVACPLLVPLIENGIQYDDSIAEMVAARYLDPLMKQGVDTIIMGCTHYPIYTETFKKIYPDALYINPGLETAVQLSQKSPRTDTNGKTDIYVSEISQAFYETADIMGFRVSKDEIKIVDVSGYAL